MIQMQVSLLVMLLQVTSNHLAYDALFSQAKAGPERLCSSCESDSFRPVSMLLSPIVQATLLLTSYDAVLCWSWRDSGALNYFVQGGR